MRLLSFDTETYLIQALDAAPKPVCCSWADADKEWLSDPGSIETAVCLMDPQLLLIGQNIAYDLVLMMRWYPRLIPSIIRALDEGRVFDTQMRERMLHLKDIGSLGYKPFPSLGDMVLKYLKKDVSADKKGDDIWRLKYGTLDGVPFDQWPSEATRYAKEDARHTFDVFQAQGGVNNIQPTEAMQIQSAVVLNATGVWGFAVDQNKRGVIKTGLEKKAAELHTQIDKFEWTGKGSQKRLMDLVSRAWHYKHFQFLQTRAQITGVQIDTALWQQYIAPTLDIKLIMKQSLEAGAPLPGLTFAQGVDWTMWCKETIKSLPDIPMTKKGVSIAGEVLEQLGDVVKEFSTYTELRHVEKMLENYIEPYSRETVHPRFVPLVTTGRTGCREPNTQNIPRRDQTKPNDLSEAFRTMFKARAGCVLGTVDYSQLELCTLAATIRTMFPGVTCALGDAIDAGKDVHCITGGLIAGMSYEAMMAGKKAKDPTVAHHRQSAKACFSGDTELLTPTGWVRIDKLYNTDQAVVQYNPHNKQMTFTKSLAWVYKKDVIVTLTTTHMDQAVTPDHRLLFASRVGITREVLAGNMHDLEMGGNNWSSIHGGYLKQEREPISEICTRLSVMVQADGNFNGNQVRLGFTKARKITRCRELLTIGGIPFNETITAQGVTVFTAQRGPWYLLTEQKTFIADWTTYHADAFCTELFRWDGHVAKKNHTSYGSTIKTNVDVAQAILSTNGYKTCYHVDKAEGNNQAYHKLEWYIGDRKKNTSYHRFGECAVGSAPMQDVYCLAVPTSWVLTRRNGRVVVSGNCNFGKPGGLGLGAFIGYAKNNYGVELNRGSAYKIISAWEKAWPEIPNVYLKHSANQVETSPTETFTAYTITGRPKANCIYTEGSNYPFQGLAADGAKAALWAIWKEMTLGWYWLTNVGAAEGYGFDYGDSPLAKSHIVNFVHDEIVAEHPEGDAGKRALARQESLMVSEMTRICQNKIKISVEGNLSDAWEH